MHLIPNIKKITLKKLAKIVYATGVNSRITTCDFLVIFYRIKHVYYYLCFPIYRYLLFMTYRCCR